jgi:hypothetical protein
MALWGAPTRAVSIYLSRALTHIVDVIVHQHTSYMHIAEECDRARRQWLAARAIERQRDSVLRGDDDDNVIVSDDAADDDGDTDQTRRQRAVCVLELDSQRVLGCVALASISILVSSVWVCFVFDVLSCSLVCVGNRSSVEIARRQRGVCVRHLRTGGRCRRHVARRVRQRRRCRRVTADIACVAVPTRASRSRCGGVRRRDDAADRLGCRR